MNKTRENFKTQES